MENPAQFWMKNNTLSARYSPNLMTFQNQYGIHKLL